MLGAFLSSWPLPLSGTLSNVYPPETKPARWIHVQQKAIVDASGVANHGHKSSCPEAQADREAESEDWERRQEVGDREGHLLVCRGWAFHLFCRYPEIFFVVSRRLSSLFWYQPVSFLASRLAKAWVPKRDVDVPTGYLTTREKTRSMHNKGISTPDAFPKTIDTNKEIKKPRHRTEKRSRYLQKESPVCGKAHWLCLRLGFEGPICQHEQPSSVYKHYLVSTLKIYVSITAATVGGRFSGRISCYRFQAGRQTSQSQLSGLQTFHSRSEEMRSALTSIVKTAPCNLNISATQSRGTTIIALAQTSPDVHKMHTKAFVRMMRNCEKFLLLFDEVSTFWVFCGGGWATPNLVDYL